MHNQGSTSEGSGLPGLQVVLFDVQQRSTIAELSTPFIKYCVWSGDMGHVALLSKHAIIIANKRLGNSCTGGLADCHQHAWHSDAIPLVWACTPPCEGLDSPIALAFIHGAANQLNRTGCTCPLPCQTSWQLPFALAAGFILQAADQPGRVLPGCAHHLEKKGTFSNRPLHHTSGAVHASCVLD